MWSCKNQPGRKWNGIWRWTMDSRSVLLNILFSLLICKIRIFFFFCGMGFFFLFLFIQEIVKFLFNTNWSFAKQNAHLWNCFVIDLWFVKFGTRPYFWSTWWRMNSLLCGRSYPFLPRKKSSSVIKIHRNFLFSHGISWVSSLVGRFWR